MKLLFLNVTTHGNALEYAFNIEETDSIDKVEDMIDIIIEGPEDKLVARIPVDTINQARNNYNIDVVEIMFTELKRIAGL